MKGLALALVVVTVLCLAKQRGIAAAPTVVFATGFERAEGYTDQLSLVGQNGWVAFGTGGNGILTNFYDVLGPEAGTQQAYIGYNPPEGNDDVLSVLRPLNYLPLTNTKPLVKFSVLMAITVSTSTNRDDFRWSVYNTESNRLFSIDFDTTLLTVNYILEAGKEFVSTGRSFAQDTIYELAITMDFAHNVWSATLDAEEMVQGQPITTASSALTLGDIDAVWVIRSPGAPGDNFMVFDNYVVTAEPLPVPRLAGEALPNLGFFLQLTQGAPGLSYIIEASSDLRQWSPIKTNVAGDGTFDWLDRSARDANRRFYRARENW
jgi:hypothetical protein